MNSYLLVGSIVSLLLCIKHLTLDRKKVLLPCFTSDLSLEVKTHLSSYFYFIAVFYVLATLILLVCCLSLVSQMYAYGLLLFIALDYALFAIWQLYGKIMSSEKQSFLFYCHWIGYFVVTGCIILWALDLG
ncbi:hypothetical protein [uncultured Shewanella sp.]|uniref:hypothetical protein n=1 Tax=uncultured Shewanella sp. TaxID=173975 RepID=UPI00262E48B1|nr:hypothetical protein [uncultured Shewanella sp.]